MLLLQFLTYSNVFYMLRKKKMSASLMWKFCCSLNTMKNSICRNIDVKSKNRPIFRWEIDCFLLIKLNFYSSPRQFIHFQKALAKTYPVIYNTKRCVEPNEYNLRKRTLKYEKTTIFVFFAKKHKLWWNGLTPVFKLHSYILYIWKVNLQKFLNVKIWVSFEVYKLVQYL